MVAAAVDEPISPLQVPWTNWRVRGVSAAIGCLCVVLFVVTLGMCVAETDRPGRVLAESVLGLTSSREVFERLGALVPGRVWVDGEWWRVATAVFLHGGWLHLAFNVMSLWSVGLWVEAAWGRTRTVGIFAVSALGGSLASMAWAGAPMVVGASAGVIGLAGALLVGRLFGRGRATEVLRPISPIFLGTVLLLTFGIGMVVPVIAQAGHVGGFLCGAGATWAGLQRGWMRWGTAAIFGFALFELGDIARRPDARPRYHELVGLRHSARGESEAALAAFERAFALEPDRAPVANEIAYELALAGRDLGYAAELIEVALTEEPGNFNYQDTKGWILCRRGEPEAGLLWLRKADEGSPEPVDEIREHLETCSTVAVGPSSGVELPASR
jgi:membrane associated rhomboid family serine protease